MAGWEHRGSDEQSWGDSGILIMREFLVKLKPVSPFHIGEVGIGLEGSLSWVPSDLLFSALCNAYAALFGEEELSAILNDFLSSPPFLISSAFPFFKDTLLFPRPLNPPPLEDRDKAKDLKKRGFIPQKLFEEWIRGKTPLSDSLGNGLELPRRELLPSVVLDRTNLNSGIYHRAALFFPKEGGLFFLLRLYEEVLEEKIRGALRLLGDMGIGGERSLGYGHFQILSFEEASLFPLPADSSPILTLSLTLPSPQDEPLLSASYYQLVLRGGWTSSLLSPRQARRKRVRMLGEGSVFPKAIKGQLLDLTPDGFPHKVYRYALTFPVEVILNA